MNRFLFLFILWITTLPEIYAFSSDNFISFSHLSVREGLSQNTVLDISQDLMGNMWFATSDGINRYDGYSFKIYRHQKEDTTSVAHDNILSICRDGQNRMWFGTRQGLSLYVAQTDRFVNYAFDGPLEGKEVRCIVDANDSTLLVGINNQVVVFDTHKGRVKRTLVSDRSGMLNPTAFLKKGDSVFIGTMNGLYVYDEKRDLLRPYESAFRKQRIQSLLIQKKDILWVGTEGTGLYRIDLQTQDIRHFASDDTDPRSLSSDYIRSLALDDRGRLWVGTFKDLNIYDEAQCSFTRLSPDPFRKGSLSQSSIRAIRKDNQGGMWVGTYYGGINYYHPLKNRFRTVVRTPESGALNDNNISCMIEDAAGDMWVATMNKGLNKWDHKTGHFQPYPLSLKKTHNIKALYLDETRKVLYAGAHAGGLSALHLASGRTTNYQPGNSTIRDENIYAILPLDDQTLLLGALNGLELFDRETGHFKRNENLASCARITSLLRDRKGQIWIGMDNGVARYSFSEGDFRHDHAQLEDTLKGIRINGLYESRDGSLWVASAGGLWQCNENSIRRFSTLDGLSNNVVYGILEDAFGRLWLSSNKGLSCLNPVTGKIKNYTDEEGIESSQFNMFSFCKKSTGEMCFGGDRGITCFYPDRIQDNPYVPQPRIHELKLFNRTVKAGDETGILEKDILFTDHITLRASQNVFSLGFVVSNYVAGKHNYFSYTLEGFDKSWYQIQDYNFVSYSNLPPGEYIFKVKAANNDNYHNENPAELRITILPVWYKTWWAILLFTGAAVLLVLLICRYFWIQRNLRNEIRMQHLEKEKTEELNQMKLRFFINISHELRTPLSLIIDPIQDIIRSTSDRKIRMQLDYAQRNAMRLLRLVNQLLDYRKAELGVLNLKVAHREIHTVLKECFESYEKLARNRHIRYTFISGVEDRLCYADANYVELMVSNFLSNAFKYTEEGGQIELRAALENGMLEISVADNGLGIKKEHHEAVFDRFYQTGNAKPGSGIGLSLVRKLAELHHGTVALESEIGRGATFTVLLPQQKDAYLSDEWSDDDDNGKREQDDNLKDKDNEMTFLLLNEEAQENRDQPEISKKGKLLLVEDNDDIRNYLKDILAAFFDITEAANGEEGLSLLQAQEVDVVLSDVMMPVMDGLKMCVKLKNNMHTSHIPVILLSAKTDECFQLDAFKTGADDYIPKPFSTAILIRKIQNQIRNRQRVIDHFSRNIQIDPKNISYSVQDEEFLSKAKAIVDGQIADIDFSTDEFAKKMNMSRSNLHLRLKAVTGESAIEFIRKIRFNRACELLEEGRYSVGEISQMVGFSSQSYFSATFKKYLGCLPSEYVRRKKMLFNE